MIVRIRTPAERSILVDMAVKGRRHAWAAVQRGPIALDRIMERALCVIDDDQIAGSGRFRLDAV